MYQTDIEPTFSFEAAARVMGLNRARELWAKYALEYKRKEIEAIALEECMARDARRNDYRVNEELGGAPEWRMAPHTYVDLYRSSLHEKGCIGGELLNDSHYMRWFLKKNPQCQIHSRSGVIMEGWTPQAEAGLRLLEARDEAVERSAEHRLNLAKLCGEAEREDQLIAA